MGLPRTREFRPLSNPAPAAQAYLIEVEDRPAGLAVRQARGFKFVAADPAFSLLDGSRFAGLGQVQEAARRLARLARAA